jgi:hypothetical protein
MSKPYIPKRFLGAFKAGHRASSREFIDEELAYKLLKRVLSSNYSDEEAMDALDYLTKFNNEYHKAVIKKGDRQALHNTKRMRQERYQANNARNRDIMSTQRHRLESLTPQPVETNTGLKLKHLDTRRIDTNFHEEALTDLIDAKNKIAAE